MPKLFEKMKIADLEIKNRIFVSPMCTYSAKEGVANDWHLVHLGGFAKGGAGLVMMEATSVDKQGRISPACCVLESKEQMQALVPITKFIRSQGSVAAIQIGHAGRKASEKMPWPTQEAHEMMDRNSLVVVGPSAIAFSPDYNTPVELQKTDIDKLINKFVNSSLLALEAGFQLIELHMAHGYLLHQFLSPISNQRSDEYGGSIENRMRFPLQVAQAVRSALPKNFPLIVRISATDWHEKGWSIEDSIVFCKELKKIGIDLIDCSSGGSTLEQKIKIGPMYQVEFAARIKQEVGIMTGAVGLIQNANEAETILQENKADAILLARAMLRNPNWAMQAAVDLNLEVIPRIKQYTRAY